ncbi:MAG: hypothetical protein V3W28_00400, partial [Thermoplasmata archaeon]
MLIFEEIVKKMAVRILLLIFLSLTGVSVSFSIKAAEIGIGTKVVSKGFCKTETALQKLVDAVGIHGDGRGGYWDIMRRKDVPCFDVRV